MTEEEIEILLGAEAWWDQGNRVLQQIREVSAKRGWMDELVTVIERRGEK